MTGVAALRAILQPLGVWNLPASWIARVSRPGHRLYLKYTWRLFPNLPGNVSPPLNDICCQNRPFKNMFWMQLSNANKYSGTCLARGEKHSGCELDCKHLFEILKDCKAESLGKSWDVLVKAHIKLQKQTSSINVWLLDQSHFWLAVATLSSSRPVKMDFSQGTYIIVRATIYYKLCIFPRHLLIGFILSSWNI